ncbi:helix-hairpin-helix domain-containing protein [Nitrosomonas sp. JL21]|uniref:helix-hairpin-helix domain-containing protein n=1 Tax=Nitrosomonas sp. JL21 TaxID=153949 RepID=UPI00136934BB|nr:helix-hairpin-helix domain-containing protein [Nitrosomonas sp. JL21]MBL8497372.1 helix-hairpin-helix domain-containing protein [Nitrosomonas sp.]MCC7092362.1 helix-hairpin-helix domain-containing protein [Nitrosomonas sp.]MXS79128.1 helix-hairpin-helix domain-containing protein [Nitrosomonas sp. JL21]
MVKITDVTGIGPVAAKALFEHNIKTVEALVAMSLDDLKKIHGFNELRARSVKKSAAECLQQAARQSAIAVKNVPTPLKKATVKKPVMKKTSPVAQQAVEPVVASNAESKKKDKDKAKTKIKDQDKKKKDKKKDKDKKKSGKKKGKGKK